MTLRRKNKARRSYLFFIFYLEATKHVSERQEKRRFVFSLMTRPSTPLSWLQSFGGVGGCLREGRTGCFFLNLSVNVSLANWPWPERAVLWILSPQWDGRGVREKGV